MSWDVVKVRTHEETYCRDMLQGHVAGTFPLLISLEINLGNLPVIITGKK